MPSTIETREEHIRYFRARRGHLVGPGATDLVTCARTLLGAQAQVESCALHALAIRVADRPDVSQIKRLIGEDRTLVRTWGQRGTLHLYAHDDLPLMSAARLTWATSAWRSRMPPEPLITQMGALFAESNKPLSRSDLIDHIPQSYVDSLVDHPDAGNNPHRLAATRLIRALARLGVIVFALKKGREQAYAHRDVWCPELAWREHDVDVACAELARRYLRVFGPATWRDVAHYFGARVGDVKRWSALLKDDVIPCVCGPRKDLWLMREDAADLRADIGAWPVRLLPAYDTVLMGHKDKQLILPNKAEEPLVWKKAAVVAATVLSEGRIVATWSHTRRAREVDVTIAPLSGWDMTHRAGVEAESEVFAAHLGLKLGQVQIAA